jgi:hypothetical protein
MATISGTMEKEVNFKVMQGAQNFPWADEDD